MSSLVEQLRNNNPDTDWQTLGIQAAAYIEQLERSRDALESEIVHIGQRVKAHLEGVRSIATRVQSMTQDAAISGDPK